MFSQAAVLVCQASKRNAGDVLSAGAFGVEAKMPSHNPLDVSVETCQSVSGQFDAAHLN